VYEIVCVLSEVQGQAHQTRWLMISDELLIDITMQKYFHFLNNSGMILDRKYNN